MLFAPHAPVILPPMARWKRGQSSAATYLRCGGNFYTLFIENLILFQQRIDFENLPRFGKVIAEIKHHLFETQCSDVN